LLPDPYAPDGCWDGDCFLARAFHFKNGVMTDLGSLAPGFNSDVSWMSPGGLISGEAQTGETDENVGFLMHGVLWAHGKMIDLGTLDGGPISLTTSVNDSAEVAGFALNSILQTRAYRWKDGVMQDLGTLGGPDAIALRINERGQISGNSYISLDPSDICGLKTGAFLWEKGKMTDLGSFGGSCTNVGDMNNRGQIVGGSFLAGDTAQRAFLWQRGAMTDLGTLGGSSAFAQSINEVGDVVGSQTLLGNDAIFHAALWTGGRIFDLGALGPDQCSFASSVNSQLQVVGLNSSGCNFEDDPSLRAVISERGGPVVDLNTLIPANSGVQLRNASIINERGEIVAVAFYQNGNHGPVLLVPCESESNSVISDSCQNIGSPPLAKASTPTTAKPYLKASPWMHYHYTTAGLQPRGKQVSGSAVWMPRKP
jgi:probable HAF family extracellular repeat protein